MENININMENININMENIAKISVTTGEGNDKLLLQSETINKSVTSINSQLKQFT